MVKLRLKRMGKIDTPFYRIVVLDSRKKRDGAYIESLGYYDPKTDPLTLKVDTDKAIQWLQKGAQPSDTVRSLLRKAGILEKWHNLKMEVNGGKETEADKTAEKKTEEKDTESVVTAEKIEEQPVVEAEEKETKPVTEEIPAVETEKEETPEKKDIEEK
jgi:small subunit ribosomal protein S16